MERNKTMKNKHITIVALAAAALATSCASEDIAEPQKQNQGEPKTVTLTASVNEAQTRVGMTKNDSKASFYWHKNDAISVLTKDGSNFYNAEFTTETEDGEASATFTGEVTGNVGGYAVYPYSESHQFTGETVLTYNLPASYTSYTPSTKIFGTSEDYLSTPTNMPMLGAISTNGDSKSISFKCLGSLAVIRIDKMPAESGTLTVTADQQLSGDFTVSDLSASDAQIATTTASDDNGKVTFTFSGAAASGVGVFYLPLAVGDYTDLTVEITYGETTQTVSYGSLSVARKSVTAIPLYNNNGTIVKYIDKSRTINGHKFIDLALPSGLLWAETNVGANSATDYGDYYNWSDATNWNAWGTECSVPTKDNFTELKNYCTYYQWTTESGVNGCRVTSAKSGNSIFLPAAGYKQVEDYGYETSETSKEQGTYGRYWSSTASGISISSPYLGFSSSWFNGGNDNISRSNKMPVRPVANP